MKQSINIVKYDELGTADFGWLKPHYHFSFSSYYNPKRLGFGQLLVINDDIIAAQSGFNLCPQRGDYS
jgi:quercetin 2,3-dioxygenase